MHRPPVEIDEEMEERGVVAESGVELGFLRAVDVGDARVSVRVRVCVGGRGRAGGEERSGIENPVVSFVKLNNAMGGYLARCHPAGDDSVGIITAAL